MGGLRIGFWATHPKVHPSLGLRLFAPHISANTHACKRACSHTHIQTCMHTGIHTHVCATRHPYVKHPEHRPAWTHALLRAQVQLLVALVEPLVQTEAAVGQRSLTSPLGLAVHNLVSLLLLAWVVVGPCIHRTAAPVLRPACLGPVAGCTAVGQAAWTAACFVEGTAVAGHVAHWAGHTAVGEGAAHMMVVGGHRQRSPVLVVAASQAGQAGRKVVAGQAWVVVAGHLARVVVAGHQALVGVASGLAAQAAWVGAASGLAAQAAWVGAASGLAAQAAWVGVASGLAAQAAWVGAASGLAAQAASVGAASAQAVLVASVGAASAQAVLVASVGAASGLGNSEAVAVAAGSRSPDIGGVGRADWDSWCGNTLRECMNVRLTPCLESDLKTGLDINPSKNAQYHSGSTCTKHALQTFALCEGSAKGMHQGVCCPYCLSEHCAEMVTICHLPTVCKQHTSNMQLQNFTTWHKKKNRVRGPFACLVMFTCPLCSCL